MRILTLDVDRLAKREPTKHFVVVGGNAEAERDPPTAPACRIKQRVEMQRQHLDRIATEIAIVISELSPAHLGQGGKVGYLLHRLVA